MHVEMPMIVKSTMTREGNVMINLAVLLFLSAINGNGGSVKIYCFAVVFSWAVSVL